MTCNQTVTNGSVVKMRIEIIEWQGVIMVIYVDKWYKEIHYDGL